MFTALFQKLSPDRRERAITVGLIASICLYLLVVLVAEPLRALGATSVNTVVQFVVTGTLSMNCSSSTTLGSAAGNGTSGTGAFASAFCTPSTNNSLGYTLSWVILSGSGVSPSVNAGCTAALPCYGTGHLLSNNVTSGLPDVIKSMRAGPQMDLTPRLLNNTTVPSGSGSRWGGRLRSSSTTPGGGDIVWGSDTDELEKYLHVNTGSAVNIARRNSPTSGAGDNEDILFKVVIPSGAFQPTGTYKATVRFTVTDN